MANEIEVGLKVVGARDLKNVTQEARKMKAAALLASVQTKKLDSTLAGLAPSLRKVNAQMKQHNILNQQSMKSSKRLGLLTQQAGYQFQDMAVQIQGGTNAAVAFGQQMSQLAGFFGPSGAMIGLGIALGSALVAPLLNAKKAANEFVEGLKEVNEQVALLQSGAENSAVLSINNQIRDVTNQIYDLENKTYDTTYMTAEMKKQFLRDIEKTKAADAEALQTLKDQLQEYNNQKKALEINKGLVGDQVQEQANLREIERTANQERLAEIKKKKEAEAKYIRDSAIMFLKAQQEVRKANGQEMEEATKKRLEALEAAEAESINRRRAVEKTYIVEMAEFFLEVQKKKHEAYMAQFSAEDAMMSMPVVEGEATDRFGAKDLLNMGYTKTYLLDIGKIKEKNAKTTKQHSTYVKELTQLEKDRLSITKSIEGQMENAFMGMVDGTKSVKDAFKSMASEIIKELYRIYVVKKITGMITGTWDALGSVGAPSMGGPSKLANGGFAAAGNSYLVGERGPEMFTPTMGGGMVTPASQTNAGGVTIVQNINVSTGVQQTVRAEIRQMMPQIAQSAKGAVLDAKRRGGSYGSSFA